MSTATYDCESSSATFDFKVANFITLLSSGKPVYLNSFMVQGLSWRIMLLKRASSLAIFLKCDHGCIESTWSCFVKVSIMLLSEPSPSFCRTIQNMFNSDDEEWGFSDFMSWDTVTNPFNNYVKNGAISLQIQVEAYPPHSPINIVVERALETKKKVVDMLNTVRNETVPIKIAKVESWKAELSQLKQDLANEKLRSEEMSKELEANRLIIRKELEVNRLIIRKELEANRLTIRSLESKIANSVNMNESGKNDSEMSIKLGSLTEIAVKLESRVATLEKGRNFGKVCEDNECCAKIAALEAELRQLRSDLVTAKSNSEKSLAIMKEETYAKLKYLTEWIEKEQLLVKCFIEAIGLSD